MIVINWRVVFGEIRLMLEFYYSVNICVLFFVLFYNLIILLIKNYISKLRNVWKYLNVFGYFLGFLFYNFFFINVVLINFLIFIILCISMGKLIKCIVEIEK